MPDVGGQISFCVSRKEILIYATKRSLENTWYAWLLAGQDGTGPGGDCVPSWYWGKREE